MSRIVLVYAPFPYVDAEDRRRREAALASWEWHFAREPRLVDAPFLDRTGTPPTITSLIEHGFEKADPEDIIVYANLDVGLTARAFDLILEGVRKGHGVTVCSRRSLRAAPGRVYDDLSAYPLDLGIDVVAMTPGWWRAIGRRKMPPMVVGRGAWDIVFLLIAQMWSDRKPSTEKQDRGRLLESLAHTDGVCWHEPHLSPWYVEWQAGRIDALLAENIRLAREFVAKIGNPETF